MIQVLKPKMTKSKNRRVMLDEMDWIDVPTILALTGVTVAPRWLYIMVEHMLEAWFKEGAHMRAPAMLVRGKMVPVFPRHLWSHWKAEVIRCLDLEAIPPSPYADGMTYNDYAMWMLATLREQNPELLPIMIGELRPEVWAKMRELHPEGVIPAQLTNVELVEN